MHDSLKACELIDHTDKRLYADSAYISDDIGNKNWANLDSRNVLFRGVLL